MLKTNIVNLAKNILPYSLRIELRKWNWSRKYFIQKLKAGNAQKVYCPIAEKEFHCFIPEKKGVWDSLITPTNGARSRHRLIWLYLKKETNIFKTSCNLLHIAPEYCYLGIFKKTPNLKYLAGDKMVDGYGKQDGVVYIDLLDLKIENERFDYILCNQVLEHIPDDHTAMKEMFRVLKPGGEAIITVPIDEGLEATYEDFTIKAPAERAKHFGQWDHVRWYGTDIKDRLREKGFEVKLVRYADHFSEEDIRRFGLCKDLIIIARKNGSL